VAYDYEFWQYNVAKSISGYSSNVDLNFWYKDAARTIGDLKVTATTPTTVSLSWSASGSVKGYRIYRYDPSQSAYVYIGETTKKSYKDSGLTSGTSYQYKVCSYWAGDGTDEYSPYTDEVSALTKPSQVQNVRVQSGVQTEVQIAWDSVAEASGYRIYKYNDSAEKYEKVTDVDSSVTSYTFTGLSGATVYDYKVKAYILRDGAYTWGTASDECIYVTNPDAVGSLTAKYKSATSVALKWSKVARATGYQIYRLSMSSGKYEKIAAVKGGSTLTYTNTGLASGTTYSYQVRAYMTEDETDYYGEFSTISSMTTGPAKVGSLKLTAASKSVTLKWSKVSGATGYEIYRLNAKTKKYEKIKTVKGDSTLTWKNTKLTKGTTYKYKVRAYRTYNGTTYYGTCSAIKSVKAK
jgi:fibronectin type 3 domain-containing protein